MKIKKFKSIILGVTFLLLISFVSVEQTSKMKIEKMIQVEMIVEEESKNLESKINKFLYERKITRDDLVDIKFIKGSTYKNALIIYEVKFEGDKK